MTLLRIVIGTLLWIVATIGYLFCCFMGWLFPGPNGGRK